MASLTLNNDLATSRQVFFFFVSIKVSPDVLLQKVQYNQKVQKCQSLRTELSHFMATPAVSTASSAAAHTGLLSTLQ
jgi:hypothetical protein